MPTATAKNKTPFWALKKYVNSTLFTRFAMAVLFQAIAGCSPCNRVHGRKSTPVGAFDSYRRALSENHWPSAAIFNCSGPSAIRNSQSRDAFRCALEKFSPRGQIQHTTVASPNSILYDYYFWLCLIIT